MVMAREFIRRFSQFKRQAQAGKEISIGDRQGQQFVFKAQKAQKLSGAGRRYYKGVLLSPEPIPDKEFKDPKSHFKGCAYL
jgi:hypothetical protein